ncbi:class I SAM-dependent methyltransferase [Vibrio gangliei]|uniref:class I SAM-dependent methyltransferase n=1 Tax=Vibrio gangliei TaxID=2077090 RepID=UPI000D013C63|nr:cyclopropane-fatty-acyl-phospholipid synthase family protein [Vibrio gangliei]
MEQTQSLVAEKSKFGWLNESCKQLVFKILNTMQDACIEIQDGTEKNTLGQPDATLRAQVMIHDPAVYRDIVKGGSIAAAEAYIAQRWSTLDLTTLIRIFARHQQELDQLERKMSWLANVKNTLTQRLNLNTIAGSKKNILAHYDLGNELYTRFLDDSMMYSCAVYSAENTRLEQAQQNKLKSICDKLDLQASDHLIEIGTGWGGLAIFAAQHYGCQVTTTTISDAQYQFAQQKIAALGLENQITLLKKDYRLLDGQYDKLVSIEMIEAVGHEYLPEFFKQCNDLLKPTGKLLIQAITIADQRYEKYRKSTDFIQKYIFPGGCLPSISVISQQVQTSTDMTIDNIEDIGLHYARTLADWCNNFENNWSEIQPFGYDDTFKRLWHYYFCYCEGAFMERVISTHHIVMRKPRYFDQHDETILDY